MTRKAILTAVFAFAILFLDGLLMGLAALTTPPAVP